jgi:hypothetical protein
MQKHTRIALAAVALAGTALLWASPAQAQGCCRGNRDCAMAASQDSVGSVGGPGMAGTYDPDTVTTLRGTASAVTVMPARGGRMGGTHVALQSDGQTMDVHLGPTWFLQSEGIDVVKGDSLEVTGSVVDSDGSTFLVARELKKGQKVVKLRDEQGIPAWSGGRRR